MNRAIVDADPSSGKWTDRRRGSIGEAGQSAKQVNQVYRWREPIDDAEQTVTDAGQSAKGTNQ